MTPEPQGQAALVHPCRCGHEKADHQQRLGQRGNYTPCCIPGCECGGFRKAGRAKVAALRALQSWTAQQQEIAGLTAELAEARAALAAPPPTLAQVRDALAAMVAAVGREPSSVTVGDIFGTSDYARARAVLALYDGQPQEAHPHPSHNVEPAGTGCTRCCNVEPRWLALPCPDASNEPKPQEAQKP